MWETWVPSLGWEDPLAETMTTHFSILAWRIVHGVAESWTRLSDFHFLSLSRKVEIYIHILYIYFPAIFSASRKLPEQSRHWENTSFLNVFLFGCTGISCDMRDLVPWLGIKPRPSAMGPPGKSWISICWLKERNYSRALSDSPSLSLLSQASPKIFPTTLFLQPNSRHR